MKIVFFDLETTGLNSEQSDIIQIGAVMDVDGVAVDEFNIKVRPRDHAVIDKKALAANGIKKADLFEDPERVSQYEAYWRFIEFCGWRRGQFVGKGDRIHRAGYNILGFDNGFIEAAGRRSGDDYTYAKFHWPGIDVASIACSDLAMERYRIEKFNLMSIAEYLGVEIDGMAHDALFDVQVTRKVYYELIKRREF